MTLGLHENLDQLGSEDLARLCQKVGRDPSVRPVDAVLSLELFFDWTILRGTFCGEPAKVKKTEMKKEELRGQMLQFLGTLDKRD